MTYSQRHNNNQGRNQRSSYSAQNGERRRQRNTNGRPEYNDTHQPSTNRGGSRGANNARPRRSGTLDLPEKEQAKRVKRGQKVGARQSRNGRSNQQIRQQPPNNMRQNAGYDALEKHDQRRYRKDDTSEHYSRSSNRYVRRPPRGDVIGNGSENASHQQNAPRGQASAQATQYSRDRYMRQPGQQHVMPVSQQNFDKARKPINPTVLIILGVVAAILVAIIAVRFVLFGSTAAEYESIQANIRQEQTQLDELSTSNTELQEQIDSWQGTIDEYNAKKQ